MEPSRMLEFVAPQLPLHLSLWPPKQSGHVLKRTLIEDELNRYPGVRCRTGQHRLDWVFVKAYLKDDPASADSYRFARHFGRSMNEANQAFNDPLSDRAPISVDLVTGACPL